MKFAFSLIFLWTVFLISNWVSLTSHLSQTRLNWMFCLSEIVRSRSWRGSGVNPPCQKKKYFPDLHMYSSRYLEGKRIITALKVCQWAVALIFCQALMYENQFKCCHHIEHLGSTVTKEHTYIVWMWSGQSVFVYVKQDRETMLILSWALQKHGFQKQENGGKKYLTCPSSRVIITFTQSPLCVPYLFSSEIWDLIFIGVRLHPHYYINF